MSTSTNNKTTQLAVVLISAVIGIAIGCILLWVDVGFLMWFAFLVLGIITVISSIPGLIQSISDVGGKYGILNLVLSIIPFILGLLLIFSQNSVVMIIVGLYMIALPIVRIVLSSDWKNALRAELPRLILGLVLVLVGPGEVLNLMFRVAGWIVIALSAVYALFGCINVLKD